MNGPTQISRHNHWVADICCSMMKMGAGFALLGLLMPFLVVEALIGGVQYFRYFSTFGNAPFRLNLRSWCLVNLYFVDGISQHCLWAILCRGKEPTTQ